MLAALYVIVGKRTPLKFFSYQDILLSRQIPGRVLCPTEIQEALLHRLGKFVDGCLSSSQIRGHHLKPRQVLLLQKSTQAKFPCLVSVEDRLFIIPGLD